MTARLLVGIFPGEPGYEAAVAMDPGGRSEGNRNEGTQGSTQGGTSTTAPGPLRLGGGGGGGLHLLSLPIWIKVLPFVGDLASFGRLFQTSKAMATLGSKEERLWRCATFTVITCCRGYQVDRAWLPQLRRCRYSLRKIVVRHMEDMVRPHTTLLYSLLLETPSLRELVYEPQPGIGGVVAYGRHGIPPVPFGVLLALVTLDIGKYEEVDLGGGEAMWSPVFQKLRTLKISHLTLNKRPWLAAALRPPHGRLRDLTVDGDFVGGRGKGGTMSPAESALHSVPTFSRLLGYTPAGKAVGPRSLLRRIEAPTFHLTQIIMDALLARRAPLLTDIHFGGRACTSICPSELEQLLEELPLRRVASWDFPLCLLDDDDEYNFDFDEEEEYEEREEEDDENEVISSVWQASHAFLHSRTLRCLELSPGAFAGLLVGFKSEDPTALVILVKLERIEELVVRVPSKSTRKDGFEEVYLHKDSILHAPCLKRLQLCSGNGMTFRSPLRIEAPQLRDVCLDGVDRKIVRVCEKDRKPGVRDGFATASTLKIVTHSLRRLLVFNSYAIKDLRLHSSSLVQVHVRGASALSTVSIDAPWLQTIKMEKATQLQYFALRSFVLSSLFISPSLLCGGLAVVPPGGSKDECYSDLLASLDLCCPSLRSISWKHCSALRSLVVEHREPPLSGTNGESAAAAAVTLLQETNIKGCEGLRGPVVFKGGSTGVSRLAPSKPRSPRRTPLAVDGRPPLQQMEVKQWPRFRRAVTYSRMETD